MVLEGDLSWLNSNDFNVRTAIELVSSELMGEKVDWDKQTMPVIKISEQIKYLRMKTVK